jgi:uncharacterized protein YbaP (TraB family)
MLAGLLDNAFRDSPGNELSSALGVGLALLNQLKPVIIAITVSMVYIITDATSALHRYSGSLPDGYFAETGKLAGKKITAFETVEEQMDLLFNSYTNEEQADRLKLFCAIKRQ